MSCFGTCQERWDGHPFVRIVCWSFLLASLAIVPGPALAAATQSMGMASAGTVTITVSVRPRFQLAEDTARYPFCLSSNVSPSMIEPRLSLEQGKGESPKSMAKDIHAQRWCLTAIAMGDQAPAHGALVMVEAQ